MSKYKFKYFGDDDHSAVADLKNALVDVALLDDPTQGKLISSTLILFLASNESSLRASLPKTTKAVDLANLDPAVVAEVHIGHIPVQVDLFFQGIPFEVQDKFEGFVEVEGPDLDAIFQPQRLTADLSDEEIVSAMLTPHRLTIRDHTGELSKVLSSMMPSYDPNR